MPDSYVSPTEKVTGAVELIINPKDSHHPFDACERMPAGQAITVDQVTIYTIPLIQCALPNKLRITIAGKEFEALIYTKAMEYSERFKCWNKKIEPFHIGEMVTYSVNFWDRPVCDTKIILSGVIERKI